MKASNPPPPLRSPIVDQSGFLTDIWKAFFTTFYASAGGVFPGTISFYASSTVPAGYLACDGSAISRKDYSDLFSVLGTAFGAGDGSTTFNLPDLVDRFIRGTISGVGTTGGNADFTIDLTHLPNLSLNVVDPQHTHVFTGTPHTHNITDPQHTHTFGVGATGGASSAGLDTVTPAGTGVTGASATGITINNATAGGTNAASSTGIQVNLLGGGEAISLLPPYLSMLYIIKY